MNLSHPPQKTALVTGGARGIGRAICETLSAGGYRVIINYYRSEKEAAELAKKLVSEGFSAADYKADVSDDTEVQKMFAAYPNINLLVNNAGIAGGGLFHETGAEAARKIFAVNYDGTSNCIHAALPYMLSVKSGCIINISSVWGLSGASCEAAYSASKAAVIGLTQALAREYGPSGIRVNCVAPGVINTDMLADYSAEELSALAEKTPLGRLGAAIDIANAVAFLASDKASFITGQTLCVDGGFLP